MSGMFDKCCDCESVDLSYDDCSCTSDSSGCPTTYCGCTKIDTKTFSVLGDATLDFGDQPPGVYFGAYCAGAGACAMELSTVPGTVTVTCGAEGSVSVDCCNGHPVWGISSGGFGFGIGGGSCPSLVWVYQATCDDDCITYVDCDIAVGSTTPKPCSGTAIQTVRGSSFGLTTEADAEADFAGVVNKFNHAGGNISLKFSDCPFDDNTDGTTQPTFSLYGCVPTQAKLALTKVCASWTTIGIAAQVIFSIENRNCLCWSDVTATLEIISGGSDPSAPQTGLLFESYSLGGPAEDLTFTFDATNVGVTVKLTLSSPQFPADVVIHAYLAPILTGTIVEDSTGTCGKVVEFDLQNTGNWELNITSMSVSTTNGWGKAGVACAITNPFTVTFSSTLHCAGDTGHIIASSTVDLAGGTGSTVATYSAITDGTLTYGTVITPSFTP